MITDVAETLASLPQFAVVPRVELDWLVARGEVVYVAAGEMLRDLDEPIDDMWILLTGRVSAHVRKAGGSSWRRFFDVGPGYVLGVMPYSRMRTSPVRIMMEDDAAVFAVSHAHFSGLVRECPDLTAALVHHMLDRTREYRTAQVHDERMQSLGRLAAGLAHELNNPASGATSHARSLSRLLDDLQAASRALAVAHLSEEQMDAVDRIRGLCVEVGQPRSSIAVADREDEFSDWLEQHHVDPTLASDLATTNVTSHALDNLARLVPRETLGIAIQWAARDAAIRKTAAEIMSATGRIHALVSAVKGFTFMDREGVPENVDIARGLAHTVAMLERKARAKAVRVRVETSDDLPTIHAYGSELNQVWEKLIDNALDAVRPQGNVTITATRRGDSVVVRVADDGVGIPEELRARVFDPFFTTKPVGEGTGLGLDVARRYVQINDGDIDFTSQPGHTVFRVRLPVGGIKPSPLPAAGASSVSSRYAPPPVPAPNES
jgi:signal transduction histidine kinase